ncbi:MAG: hypothetical protein ACYCUV_13625, partial [Phycisphaerae bacterium]
MVALNESMFHHPGAHGINSGTAGQRDRSRCREFAQLVRFVGSGRSGRSGSNNLLVNSNDDALYRRSQVIEAATSAVIAAWQFYGPGRIAEAALVNSTLGSAFTYNSLNQLTIYQRGDVTVSGNIGSIAGATLTQDMAWNPQGALILESVNGTTVLNNLGNAQNQNTSNTYNSNGDASSSTNAAGSAVNTVFNAWGQPVSYTVSQAANGINFTQTETIQYDALGRPLGQFESGTFPGEASTIQTQHTLVYDANTGKVIQEVNEIDGTDPVLYVYAPNGDVIMQKAGPNGASVYALQDAQGSTVAITDDNGNVVERYVYDGLGNAQALDSSGNPYPVSTTSGDANWQFQEQFSGSTFDASTQLLTAEGTHYAWNILYHDQMYDGIAGVYETPQGAFNPGIQSLLAPERGVVQVAGNPYNPGSVTMLAWIERIEGGFQTVGGA